MWQCEMHNVSCGRAGAGAVPACGRLHAFSAGRARVSPCRPKPQHSCSRGCDAHHVAGALRAAPDVERQLQLGQNDARLLPAWYSGEASGRETRSDSRGPRRAADGRRSSAAGSAPMETPSTSHPASVSFGLRRRSPAFADALPPSASCGDSSRPQRRRRQGCRKASRLRPCARAAPRSNEQRRHFLRRAQERAAGSRAPRHQTPQSAPKAAARRRRRRVRRS